MTGLVIQFVNQHIIYFNGQDRANKRLSQKLKHNICKENYKSNHAQWITKKFLFLDTKLGEFLMSHFALSVYAPQTRYYRCACDRSRKMKEQRQKQEKKDVRYKSES